MSVSKSRVVSPARCPKWLWLPQTVMNWSSRPDPELTHHSGGCHGLKQSTWPRTDPPLRRLSWTEAVDLTQNWPTSLEAVMDWSSRPDPKLTHQSGGCRQSLALHTQSPGSAYQQTVDGSRAFPVAGPQTWNDLPEDVTSAESLTTHISSPPQDTSVQEVFTCWTLTDCLRWTLQ